MTGLGLSIEDWDGPRKLELDWNPKEMTERERRAVDVNGHNMNPSRLNLRGLEVETNDNLARRPLKRTRLQLRLTEED